MNTKVKTKKKKIDYERFDYGPIKLERFGRFIRASSNWGPGEHEDFKEKVLEDRPKLKKDIDNKIQRNISLINQYNPFDLLSSLSLKNSFADPEKYKESTHEGRESYCEYALGLVLSQAIDSDLPRCDNKHIELFNNLIEEIYEGVMFYFSSEITEGKSDEIDAELRLSSIIRYLYVRGDSYIEHHYELIRDVFSIHDTFLKEHYGIIIDDIIITIQNIFKQLPLNIKNHINYDLQFQKLHKQFQKFVDNKEYNGSQSIKEIKKKYNNLPEVREGVKKLGELKGKIENHPFDISHYKDVSIDFLNLISAKFGENEEFATFKKSPGWPTNNSIIYRKPIISEKSKYYCFFPHILDRNVIEIVESMISQKDRTYFNTKYQKKRAEYLENKTLEYLNNILPGAQIYGKLFYSFVEKGENKRAETDGLILYDDNIIIVEAKAGDLSQSTRRGSLKRMKTDVENLVDEAYKQSLRTKSYIENNSEPEFYDENGRLVISFQKNQYNNIYLFNTTFENLAHLSIQLNSLKKYNLIKGNEWPWSVFINDLRIISEITEFPSQFLHYLQRRLKANDYPQFIATDELDFFMFYLYEGLYFEDDKLKSVGRYTPFAYTEDLDRYYDFLGGRVKTGDKPKLHISDEYKRLITDIEKTKKYRFTKITTILLSFGHEAQTEILKGIEKIKVLFNSDRKAHDFTLYFNDMNLGVTVAIFENRDLKATKKMDAYCSLKMYQTHLEEWIVLFIDINNKKESFDFRIFKKMATGIFETQG